jgi:hypothetical protein
MKKTGFSPAKYALKQQKAAFLENIPRKRTFVWRNYNGRAVGKATKKAPKNAGRKPDILKNL